MEKIIPSNSNLIDGVVRDVDEDYVVHLPFSSLRLRSGQAPEKGQG